MVRKSWGKLDPRIWDTQKFLQVTVAVWAFLESHQWRVCPGTCPFRETGRGKAGVWQRCIFCCHPHYSVVNVLQLSGSLRSYLAMRNLVEGHRCNFRQNKQKTNKQTNKQKTGLNLRHIQPATAAGTYWPYYIISWVLSLQEIRILLSQLTCCITAGLHTEQEYALVWNTSVKSWWSLWFQYLGITIWARVQCKVLINVMISWTFL